MFISVDWIFRGRLPTKTFTRASGRADVLSLARGRAFSGFKVPANRNESNNECCALELTIRVLEGLSLAARDAA